MTNNSLKDRLSHYIDAGFPILYINSFEENKADEIIGAVAGRREVFEWNGSNGFVDFKTKVSFAPNHTLEDTLIRLNNKNEVGLKHKLLVLKDMHCFLENDKIIALLKLNFRSSKIDTWLDLSPPFN